MEDESPRSRAEVRGVDLAYDVTGRGPHLIWGHGLSMSCAADDRVGLVRWDRVHATVVRYDARGHGDSGSTAAPHDYAWSELARDQLTLADALGIEEYVSAGASMGCGTALFAALLAPTRVRGLVLVIPPTAWEVRAAQASIWRAGADMVTERGVEAFVDARASLAPPDPYKDDRTWRDRHEESLRAWEPERLARVLRGAGVADLPSREEVAAITTPALILGWTGDPIHPRSTAEELARLLPRSDLHMASTLDDVEQWSALIDGFVSTLA